MGQLFKYGNKRLQVFFVDDDGYPIGIPLDGSIPDPNAPALDEVYHAYVLEGYVTSTPAVREVDVATNKSDGKNYGDVNVGINTQGTLEIELSSRSELFSEMIRQVTANTTFSSGMRISSRNANKISMKNMGIIITDLVRDEDTGVLEYEHEVYNKGTFEITAQTGGNQSAGVNPSPLTISFKPLPSERHVLTGALYSALDMDVEENSDIGGPIRSEHEFTFSTYIKDGTATTFVTKYKPKVAGATVGGVNTYTTEGTQAALTSFATTTGLATMTAPGTSGHRAVLAYATNFIEV